MSTDSRSFRPPSWCRVPREPERRRQALFLASEGEVDTPVADISDKAFYTIGRCASADIQLKGEQASRMHAALLQDADGRKFLVDLKSTHGTFLDAKRLTPHHPVRWMTGRRVIFGTGSKAEALTLFPECVDNGTISPAVKRRRTDVVRASASLYDGLPTAAPTVFVPKPEVVRTEPEPPLPGEPTKIIFLDVDGVLRPVHGRSDFIKHVRVMEIDGARVPILGNAEARAGLDFWPHAMRALKHCQILSGAGVVLSSDWRKEEILREGVKGALSEYRIPKLYDITPDLDQATPGVIRSLHSSFRDKRCKEIRKWLRQHPKVERFVAIDDVDLSLPDKQAKMEETMGGKREEQVFLNPHSEFVRTNPTQGLTHELAKLAAAFLNGHEVTSEEFTAAYSSFHDR